MIVHQITGVVERVVERLIVLARKDEELRQELGDLAGQILAALVPESSVEEAPGTEVETIASLPEPAERQAETPLSPRNDGPESPLSAELGLRATLPPAQPALTFVRVSASDADLPLIEARLRLKAEGARWAAKRRTLMENGTNYQIEIEPIDRDIIERARQLPECFLWMCHPTGPCPADLSAFELAADAFETTAVAVGLIRRLQGDSAAPAEAMEQVMSLLAEAQSALRVAVERLGARPDKDQQKTYFWLKETCARNGIFIRRFMTLDDPANPCALEDLDARIEALDRDYRQRAQASKARESALKRIRYHVKRAGAGNGEAAHDWDRVIETVDWLVRDGLPPSNPELRELLIPVVEQLPVRECLPVGFQLTLREIDRYLASQRREEVETVDDDPGDDVRQVGELLRGRKLVLIGGLRRPHAHDAIIRAFGLEELLWLEAPEHESIFAFEPYVARPDVAAVLLAIRWSSHSYGEVRGFCERYGKPLIRLPAGYNPRQVAVQILQQCGGALAEKNQRV